MCVFECVVFSRYLKTQHTQAEGEIGYQHSILLTSDICGHLWAKWRNMEDIVRYYFKKKYTYGVILYCLEKYHGTIISRGTILNRLKDYVLCRYSCVWLGAWFRFWSTYRISAVVAAVLCFMYPFCVLHICVVFCMSVLCFAFVLCRVVYVCVTLCICGLPQLSVQRNKEKVNMIQRN